MDDRLQIREHEGEGFKALVTFRDWRVGILRAEADMVQCAVASMERHTETDEVFVLTGGRAILLLGGSAREVEAVRPQAMDIGRIYNVRRNAWHTILMSRDASIVIVESDDTGPENSEYADISAELRQAILEIALREQLV